MVLENICFYLFSDFNFDTYYNWPRDKFYKTILIQFGWDLKSENNNEALVFIRDNEILKININKTNNILFSSFLSLKNN